MLHMYSRERSIISATFLNGVLPIRDHTMPPWGIAACYEPWWSSLRPHGLNVKGPSYYLPLGQEDGP